MWKKGPLPPGTYHWGGVVVEGNDPKSGFHFADFKGNHVVLADKTRVEAHDVAFWNNSLTFPIVVTEDKDCPDCKVC